MDYQPGVLLEFNGEHRWKLDGYKDGDCFMILDNRYAKDGYIMVWNLKASRAERWHPANLYERCEILVDAKALSVKTSSKRKRQ